MSTLAFIAAATGNSWLNPFELQPGDELLVVGKSAPSFPASDGPGEVADSTAFPPVEYPGISVVLINRKIPGVLKLAQINAATKDDIPVVSENQNISGFLESLVPGTRILNVQLFDAPGTTKNLIINDVAEPFIRYTATLE